MVSGNDVRYERVSEMFRAIRTIESYTSYDGVDGEIERGGFHCYDDSLDAGNSPLTIQAGDILGVCVFDPDGILFRFHAYQLDVVGGANGQSVLQMSATGCTLEAIPSSIPAGQLSTLSSRRVHIYANIGKK